MPHIGVHLLRLMHENLLRLLFVCILDMLRKHSVLLLVPVHERGR
jgi:hypothetical protein